MADPIQEVLQAFAHGELVVVTDDDDREGEGDLIVAASLCTAELIAYRQAREKLIERVATFTTDSPIGPLQGYAYRSPFDSIAHVAFVYNGVGDGKNVLTRFHKPNIVKDTFTGHKRMAVVLEHFKKSGRGVLVYLRDGAAGVPVAPLPNETSTEADRNRQWREVGVGAQ